MRSDQLHSLALCHFMSPALRHSCLQGQLLLFQEVFNSVYVHKPSDNLFPDIFLDAFVGAEVTRFCQFSQGHQEVIKRLALLLHTLPEVAALDRLVELSSNILLDRRQHSHAGLLSCRGCRHSDRLPGKA